MRQERAVLLGKAAGWALATTLPGALCGWGLAYLFGLFAERLGPDWTTPGADTGLLLGALCGALGGATAGLFYHAPSEEEPGAPVLVVGVTVLVALAGGIWGAGRGGLLYTGAGLALGIPAGVCVGLIVLAACWALSAVGAWARHATRGH
jgi:hypothetical protein